MNFFYLSRMIAFRIQKIYLYIFLKKKYYSNYYINRPSLNLVYKKFKSLLLFIL
jgi:hypothetical protein